VRRGGFLSANLKSLASLRVRGPHGPECAAPADLVASPRLLLYTTSTPGESPPVALEVIGAGFGRTGTASMKLALEELGLGPCHHMLEVLKSPEQTALWRAALKGNLPNWDEAFAGYHSSVDFPSSLFWRELTAYYPEAKVLLTVRSPESWYASMERTLIPIIRNSTDQDSIGVQLSKRLFPKGLDDEAGMIEALEKNTTELQAAFGPERLLTYHVGDGWQPLCEFLEQPVPDRPFPRTNTADEFVGRIASQKERGASGDE
jgi:Sulfotransferase domain